MKVFLDKVAQLASVHDLRLQNFGGEPLYHYPNSGASKVKGEEWKPIIAGLGDPESADFIYENGRYLLFRLAFGNLLIGINSEQNLKTIREGCLSVKERLQDDTICRNVLLRMFSENRKTLRPQFITSLTFVAGPEVASALIPALKSIDAIPEPNREIIAAAICQVLGNCRSGDALVILEAYLRQREQAGEGDTKAALAAQVAIAQLKLDKPGSVAGGASILSESAAAPAPAQPVIKPQDLTPEEREIIALADQGSKKQAIDRIMHSIRAHSAKKNFGSAESLRQLLIRIDPMALRDIITAAEIIEEEKTASLSDTLLTTWDNLIETLSIEEFSALYHVMNQRETATEEIIATQGDFLTNLFFVNIGRVQLYTTSQGRDDVFRTVPEGEIFGADSFFDISVWTVSAKSLGASLSVLSWKQLATLKNDYPALQNNLLEFSARFRNDYIHFRKPASSRRRYERKKLTGRATMELVASDGSGTGQVARGDLLDISQGGLSFVLRFHRKEYATELLGRNIKLVIRPENSLSPIEKTGKVKAVRSYDFVGNDYSVHVEFDSIMRPTEVANAASSGRSQE